ncbi:hypothetical protein A2348_03140 [Candidatus Uhrbacteria bacterium RIFOXYB12_FULL_58_10]|uniref:JAB domain-containing protein n=1 Tax=Candidatus Uhrbacteria bacterium RIFOXYB2_FULL_57_15 TaxID=1802422 RepID=A0A1F7W5P3_9BACT|nr:MAG: hypothetical protein A2348_03140 [Candidatus Uhrbacteria bacterium RIFOXYB12_FULL_58_10]OGL97956.1 MAG: hypothetical protein A2304_05380 [Candidatus Uhrbacteria bacterium RIFOXYB2_FULL_57_15]OGM00639.1 MAG: hypothetical protein A2501_04045 [Candidatus Uhrbacteria bacterium RIFOXYC12_FULL_57_11]
MKRSVHSTGIPVIVRARGDEPIPDDVPLCYIVACNGVFLRKKVGIVEAIVRVENIPMLKPQEMCGELDVTKVPMELFAQILVFFRAVFARQKAEAVVILLYCPATREWQAVAPMQRGHGGGVHYEDDLEIGPGWLRAGTVHSHCDFSAFHSGGDHNDEMNWDGLHVTVGNITRDVPTMSASVVVNGHRFLKGPDEYVGGITPAESVVRVTRYESVSVLVPATTKGTAAQQAKRRVVPVDYLHKEKGFAFKFHDGRTLDDYPCPPEWMDKVHVPPPPRKTSIVITGTPVSPHCDQAFERKPPRNAFISAVTAWADDAFGNFFGVIPSKIDRFDKEPSDYTQLAPSDEDNEK